MKKLLFVILGVMMVSLVQLGNGQDRWCINQLVPCLNYINNGTEDVPNSCCNPLKNVVKLDPNCLCQMASNKGSRQAEQAGIDIDQAQQLPARCGLRINLINCLRVKGSNSRNSADNSSSFNIFPSSGSGMIMAIFLSIVFQILWCIH